MRSWAVAWVMMTLGVVNGCGDDSPGVGTAQACAGSYTGTFSGSESGTLSGTLGQDGSIDVTFTGSAGSLSGAGSLGADGRLDMQIGGNAVTGSLNASCQAGGTWNYPGVGSGTWQMRRATR